MVPPSAEPDHSNGAGENQLLPGWSSLVILLTLFGVISAVTLMVILGGDEARVTPNAGGTRPYGPADFPEIDFDPPLLPELVEAAEGEEPEHFTVPPAPFTPPGLQHDSWDRRTPSPEQQL